MVKSKYRIGDVVLYERDWEYGVGKIIKVQIIPYEVQYVLSTLSDGVFMVGEDNIYQGIEELIQAIKHHLNLYNRGGRDDRTKVQNRRPPDLRTGPNVRSREG